MKPVLDEPREARFAPGLPMIDFVLESRPPGRPKNGGDGEGESIQAFAEGFAAATGGDLFGEIFGGEGGEYDGKAMAAPDPEAAR
ncbi:MAG: hypothetical protein ACU0BS_10185 [Hasllibacter sp.]